MMDLFKDLFKILNIKILPALSVNNKANMR